MLLEMMMNRIISFVNLFSGKFVVKSKGKPIEVWPWEIQPIVLIRTLPQKLEKKKPPGEGGLVRMA
jgi:hypothetical protein